MRVCEVPKRLIQCLLRTHERPTQHRGHTIVSAHNNAKPQMLSQEIREKPAVIMSTCEAMAKYRREYQLVSALLVAPFRGLNYPMNHGYHRLILSVRNPSYVLIM